MTNSDPMGGAGGGGSGAGGSSDSDAPFEVECFNKPPGCSDAEFDKQLKEQEDAINNTSADTLCKRRQAIRNAGGTKGVRDHAAQRAAAAKHATKLTKQLAKGNPPIVGAAAEKAVAAVMSKLAATHRLDIIAGGDPSDISGMGDRRVNSSLGPQWKGRRADSLEEHAKKMKKQGKGAKKLKVKLKKC
jgi:hypothetical protein